MTLLTTAFTLDDFDYVLPPELIAQHPSARRGASRLLRLAGDSITDHIFDDITRFIAAGDLLVMNDTKVIKARLYGTKDSSGKVEVLVERIVNDQEALVHLRASKSPRAGSTVRLADAIDATVLGRDDDLFHLRFDSDATVLELLERYGAVPLPPYIEHAPSADDQSRYQTVYARHPGAIAAPTAGLHFDEPALARLQAQGVGLAYVTLHVGAGTFQPVRETSIEAHKMHREWYAISPSTVAAITATRARGGKVFAVGTTSLRALESAARDGTLRAGSADTELFIRPGFQFHVVDRLLTNFHLPKSTLMMLVSAFAGFAPIRRAYAHAIAQRYRFFSYGDAMLIDRADRVDAR